MTTLPYIIYSTTAFTHFMKPLKHIFQIRRTGVLSLGSQKDLSSSSTTRLQIKVPENGTEFLWPGQNNCKWKDWTHSRSLLKWVPQLLETSPWLSGILNCLSETPPVRTVHFFWCCLHCNEFLAIPMSVFLWPQTFVCLLETSSSQSVDV